ncbi:MAG: response regulator, partial [Myxococcota bacterium]
MPTILAVDDSATMRKCLEIAFAGTEFTIVTCETADEAVGKAQELSPDIVIADVSLPGDGYALCGTIKAAAPGARVVMLSSKHNPFDAAKGDGADGHIDKPFDTQVMQDRARELMQTEPKAAPAGAAAPAPAAREVGSAKIPAPA